MSVPVRVVVDETRFLLEETSDALFITAVSANLARSDIPGGRHVAVRAYEVTLAESLTLPGRNVEIFCRTLHTTGSVTIDTSGEPGTDMNFGATGGRAAGEGGTRGEPGGNGGNAGNIRIVAESIAGDLVCRANGGRGGKGQSGGNGATGGVGRDGGDADRRQHGGQGEAGHPGGRGGDAGPGGNGGAGGNAGTIEIRLLRKPEGKIEFEALPGAGGAAGSNGQPGPGGPGGRGGQKVSCTWEPSPRL